MYQGLNPSTPYCYAQHLPIEPPRPVANLTLELGFIVKSRCRDCNHGKVDPVAGTGATALLLMSFISVRGKYML